MLKQPLGVLGETAKAGQLVVSTDGLGVMVEGRVVSAGGRSGSGFRTNSGHESLDERSRMCRVCTIS